MTPPPHPARGHDRARLAADLTDLGLRRDHDVLVHCSMRQLGWIDGDAPAVLAAIREVAGPKATVVVPAYTTRRSPTSRQYRNEVAAAMAEGMTPEEAAGFVIGSAGPPETGRLARFVAARPDAARSAHPLTSFAAIGPNADRYMSDHELASHFGPGSPVDKLYAAGASILMLGVGYESCSALHLAEYRLASPSVYRYTYYRDGDRHTAGGEFTSITLDDADFPQLGDDLDKQRFVSRGWVGSGPARAMPLRETVDFAVGWMTVHRGSAA
jgi:aminoglycoside 3-N-acetyltransferase